MSHIKMVLSISVGSSLPREAGRRGGQGRREDGKGHLSLAWSEMNFIKSVLDSRSHFHLPFVWRLQLARAGLWLSSAQLEAPGRRTDFTGLEEMLF